MSSVFISELHKTAEEVIDDEGMTKKNSKFRREVAKCIRKVRREMRWAAEMGKHTVHIDFMIFGLSLSAAKKACLILSEAYGESGATFDCVNIYGVTVTARW